MDRFLVPLDMKPEFMDMESIFELLSWPLLILNLRDRLDWLCELCMSDWDYPATDRCAMRGCGDSFNSFSGNSGLF